MSTIVSLTLLQQREIEANIVGPLFRAVTAEVGEQRARGIFAEVIRQLARGGGCVAAQVLGGNGIPELRQAVEKWRAGDALTLEVIRHDAHALEFNVTRCQFAEMYRRLGLEELGAILSCDRDEAMIQGFNPDIELVRTQTILGGATHCDFRYSSVDDGKS